MSEALHYLPGEQFRQVIASTPLVSIDIVLVHERQALLGQRLNRPAQGYWFVPGGRIRKNETLAAAFQRLTLNELGVGLAYDQARFLGAFDHFYTDSVFGEEPSTHYVALGMYLELPKRIEHLPEEQHDAFAWWPIQHALSDAAVHKYTKDYLHTLLKD